MSTQNQVQSSQRNGAKSRGPVTLEGKAASAKNAVRTGVSSSFVLMPWESEAEYEENFVDWIQTLVPRSPAELQLVGTMADAAFRLRRVDRLEQRLQEAAVEAVLANSELGQALSASTDAKAALGGLLEALALREDLPLAELAPALRATAGMVERAGASPEGIRGVVLELVAGESGPQVTATILATARNALQEIEDSLPDLVRRIAKERQELPRKSLLGADADQARIDRRRRAIQAEQDRLLEQLKKIRELTLTRPPGSSEPVNFVLRLVRGFHDTSR